MRASTYWKSKIKNILINATENIEQIVSRRMDYYFKKYYKAVNKEKKLRGYRWEGIDKDPIRKQYRALKVGEIKGAIKI